MKRIPTELKGVSTVSTYEDGAMYSLVNLRRKGGVLHPVAPHAVEMSMCGEYDIYFIHRSEGWEHFILIENGIEDRPEPKLKTENGGFPGENSDPELKVESFSDVYWSVDPSDCGDVRELKFGVPGVVNSVEQNGNMLIFITDDAMYYALWRGGPAPCSGCGRCRGVRDRARPLCG